MRNSETSHYIAEICPVFDEQGRSLIGQEQPSSPEQANLPKGVLIVICGKPGVGKTLTAENFARINGLEEPLTIGRLIRKWMKIHPEAMSLDPSKRSPKLDRRADELAINEMLNYPEDGPPRVIESDLGVWQAGEAIRRGLNPRRVITVKLDAGPGPTGIRALKREKAQDPTALDPEKATPLDIEAAYNRTLKRNEADMTNWEKVYKEEVGYPYDDSRFDALINTDNHIEGDNKSNIHEVSKAIKRAVEFVLAARDKSNEGNISTLGTEHHINPGKRRKLPKAS
ncbi:hypothetical protein C4577_04830 [Candidatus Parcubacteria bacterium]|nr:MAG: hypothetical protein C4577_04830 [Candidatus Parcubacteria bacterium]